MAEPAEQQPDDPHRDHSFRGALHRRFEALARLASRIPPAAPESDDRPRVVTQLEDDDALYMLLRLPRSTQPKLTKRDRDVAIALEGFLRGENPDDDEAPPAVPVEATS
jgi:hypothetical protein